MSITGRIEDWEVRTSPKTGSLSIYGTLYGDVLKRAPDGSRIHTSRLLPMSMQVSTPKEGATVRTHNSLYLLGKPKGESCE